MDTFDLKVTNVHMFGLVIMVPWKPWPLIYVIFLVAMVNLITKATDVPMLTFGTTVIKVINVNWFSELPETSECASFCRNFLSRWRYLG